MKKWHLFSFNLFIFVRVSTVKNISQLLPKHLFWDVDSSKLDIEADKDFIIPRALFATTESTFDRDIEVLERLYSKQQIVFELSNTKERVSNNVCEMVARRYHVKQLLRFK